jgi:hypothetical protein
MSLGSITADFVGVLQLAHVLLAVRLNFVFLLLPFRWTITTKYAKKVHNTKVYGGTTSGDCWCQILYTEFVWKGTNNDS